MANKVTKSQRLDSKPAAVQSVYRAAHVLACIGKHINSMTEIAQTCHLSNSTVHRLLQALEDSNMVIQDPLSRRYYFGDLITRLVSSIQIPYEYFITVAREHLILLSDGTSETISLAVLVGQQYNTLSEIPSKNKLRVVGASVNSIEPLEPSSATAKVLLSQLDDKELISRVNNILLTSEIDDTLQYVEEIKAIRKEKLAFSEENSIGGAMCISASILNYISPAVVSLYGPRERVRPFLAKYSQLLKSSASHISNRLGDTIKAKQI